MAGRFLSARLAIQDRNKDLRAPPVGGHFVDLLLGSQAHPISPRLRRRLSFSYSVLRNAVTCACVSRIWLVFVARACPSSVASDERCRGALSGSVFTPALRGRILVPLLCAPSGYKQDVSRVLSRQLCAQKQCRWICKVVCVCVRGRLCIVCASDGRVASFKPVPGRWRT